MKIKVIATGSGQFQRFIRRWGVSFLIGEDVLFDTFGDPGVLLGRMRKFNVDPSKIKHIVLSHDDWDHISGLWYLISKRNDVTVYVCPGSAQEIKDRIVSSGVKLVESDKPVLIKGNIYTTGELYGESGGRKIHEQSVVIKDDAGLTVICGCAHPGVDNIVKKSREYFNADVHLLIGGFHLKDNTDEANTEIIKNLKQAGIRRIMPMHCTGKRAVKLTRQAFGDGFMWLREGDEIEP